MHGVEITLTDPLKNEIYSFLNVHMKERHFVLEETKNSFIQISHFRGIDEIDGVTSTNIHYKDRAAENPSLTENLPNLSYPEIQQIFQRKRSELENQLQLLDKHRGQPVDLQDHEEQHSQLEELDLLHRQVLDPPYPEEDRSNMLTNSSNQQLEVRYYKQYLHSWFYE